LLASHRDPESYVAGSTPLNRNAPRYSADIDVFHDREERVAQAAEQDGALLQEHGYSLQWLRRDPAIHTVMAARTGESTKLEWVADSDYRFFPAVPDEDFGVDVSAVECPAIGDLNYDDSWGARLHGTGWRTKGRRQGNQVRRFHRCFESRNVNLLPRLTAGWPTLWASLYEQPSPWVRFFAPANN
jgi:hypothetical protein